MKADLFFDKIADLVFLKNLRKKSEVCELYKSTYNTRNKNGEKLKNKLFAAKTYGIAMVQAKLCENILAISCNKRYYIW